MHSFYNILFTLSLFFVFSSFANDKREHSFIRFVRNQLGENFSSEMPKNWETKVTRATRSWNEPEMDEFLSFLEERIGRDEALKRIRSVSYFNTFRFKSFLERVRLYERYIGREGVNERLRKSLGGFHKNSVENIEANIKYIESYIGRDEVIERMKKDLYGFSRAKLSELKQVVEFIEDYIGRDEVIERMKKDLQGFSRAKLSELTEVVEYIESYIGKDEVIERMKKDLRSFSRIDLNQLKQKEEAWGQQKMKDMLDKYNLRNPIFSI